MNRAAALAALLILSAPAAFASGADRDAFQIVRGDDAEDCDCPSPTFTPSFTATPTPSPSFTPTPSATVMPEVAAIQDLGFAAEWETPGVLLVTLSDETARFDNARDDLKPDAVSRLKKLSRLLIRFPGNTLRVDGHTDSKGREAFNLSLSLRRAKRVQEVMLGMGLKESMFEEVKGWAAAKPLTSDATPEGQATNRRVEVRVRFKTIEVGASALEPTPTATPEPPAP